LNDLLADVLTWTSLYRNIKKLDDHPKSETLRQVLAQRIVPSYGHDAVDVYHQWDFQDKCLKLESLGLVKRDDYEFLIPIQLMFRIMKEKFLIESFKDMFSFPPPRLADGRYDVIAMIQVVAPKVVKAAQAHCKVSDRPHAIACQNYLEATLAAWINTQALPASDRVSGEIHAAYDPMKSKGEVYIDVKNNDPHDRGRRIVLVVFADNRLVRIDKQLKKTHEHEINPEVSRVFFINFTESKAEYCFVEDKNSTPIIHVRHDGKGNALGLLVTIPNEKKLKELPVEIPEEGELAVKVRPKEHGINYRVYKHFMV
jgi:hypothetical protein